MVAGGAISGKIINGRNNKMRIHNLYTDENGESHFHDIEVEWAKQGPGGQYTQTLPATGISFIAKAITIVTIVIVVLKRIIMCIIIVILRMFVALVINLVAPTTPS